MAAIPGTVRMEMRINLEEQAPGETLFRTVTDPSLGVWHLSAAGVKVFAHIQQVTDLSAPGALPRRAALPLAERQESPDQERGTAHGALRTAGPLGACAHLHDPLERRLADGRRGERRRVVAARERRPARIERR